MTNKSDGPDDAAGETAQLPRQQIGAPSVGSAAAADAAKLVPSFRKLACHLRAKHHLIKLNRWNATRAQVGEVEQLGKVPLRGWRTAEPLTENAAREHMLGGGNIGIRLRKTDLVVDVDPRNFPEGRNTFRELCAALTVDPDDWPHVHTGGGGYHYYLTKPAELDIVGGLPDYPGVEFKSFRRQVLAAGCIHPKTRAFYSVDPLMDRLEDAPCAPATLLDALRRSAKGRPESHGASIAAGQLGELLEGLDPQEFRDQEKWLHLMMACHHASGGQGDEEFISWSIADPEYAGHESIIRRRWNSLDPNKADGYTLATLCQHLQEAGRFDLVERARAADTRDEFEDDDSLPAGARAARKQVEDEWVWVADASRFIRRWDLKKYKPDQWKSLFAHLKPDGDVLSAVWKGNIPIRKFGALVYLPGSPEIITKDSESCYNLWRPSGVDAKAGDTSWFAEHLAYLFPNDVERDLVLDYLAVLIQRPAEKLHFALLVRGEQGTGKSALGEIMLRIIGQQNVVKPSNEEVNGRFSAWQEGAQLAIIEELMVVGRLELANRLKPVITDPVLRIEEKFGTPYSIPNHLNLLCYTNHRDALKIETGDRRWLVIFSPAKPRSEEYYRALFARIGSDEGAAAVKHLLLNRVIALNPKGTAPETRAKQEMRRLSMGEIESRLLELFEDGERPFDFDLVRLDDLIAAVPQELARRHKNLRSMVSKFLQDEIKAVQQSRYTKDDTWPNYRLWSIRNHKEWEDRGPTARIEAYLQSSQSDFSEPPPGTVDQDDA